MPEGLPPFLHRDTAGQERYASLAPLYYRGAAAAIIVYDVTSKSSFAKAKHWISELHRNASDNLGMPSPEGIQSPCFCTLTGISKNPLLFTTTAMFASLTLLVILFATLLHSHQLVYFTSVLLQQAETPKTPDSILRSFQLGVPRIERPSPANNSQASAPLRKGGGAPHSMEKG